jgi:methylmalonyl-CoA epimerase
MIKAISHLGIATYSIEEAKLFYDLLRLEQSDIETVEDQFVRVLKIHLGETSLELLEPTRPDSPVGRFLEKNGAGVHHVALEVSDLDSVLEMLREKGVRLIDSVPRRGAGKSRIAFIHPEAAGGILYELCERSRE